MAAPAPSIRVAPGGIRLDNGHSTKITMSGDTDISFWERTVQPPGLDNGDKIDTSTMHNTSRRTFAPRSLSEMTDVNITAGYDPALYTQIDAQLGVPQTITCRFPDGSTVAFYGYLQKFEPQDNEDGSFPECNIVIVPTNYDPTNRVEAKEVVASVAGT